MNSLYNSGQYTMIIGASGTGKTTKIIVPQLIEIINNQQSFLITNPKNEIATYVYEYLVKSDYKIMSLNLRNKNESHSWNPLLLPYKYYRFGDIQKAYDLLMGLSEIIFVSDEKGGDPFWEIASRDLFVGLAISIFEHAENINQVNMKSIFYMVAVGFDKFQTSFYLKEFYNYKRDIFSYAFSCVSATISAPTETRASILSVFNQKIRSFAMGQQNNVLLGNNEFDFTEVASQKTAIFLQYDDEKMASSEIINVFIRQLCDVLINDRTINHESKKRSFNIILDDFLCQNRINNFEQLILGCKNRNINLTLSISSLSLLQKKYGNEVLEALKSNCETLYFLSVCENLDFQFLNRNFDESNKCANILEDEYFLVTKSNIIKKKFDSRQLTFSVNNPICFQRQQDDIPYFKLDQFVKENCSNDIKTDFPFNVPIEDVIKRIDRRIEELETMEQSENK